LDGAGCLGNLKLSQEIQYLVTWLIHRLKVLNWYLSFFKPILVMMGGYGWR